MLKSLFGMIYSCKPQISRRLYFIIIQVILYHILLYFIFYIVIGFEKPFFFLENLIKYVCMYVLDMHRLDFMPKISNMAAV